MKKRRLDNKRLYRLAKIIVLIITSISAILAIYWLYLLESNTLLHSWESFCTKSPTYLDCMSLGMRQINNVQNMFDKASIVAIGLPIIFFGGTALFKYLFPKIEA